MSALRTNIQGVCWGVLDLSEVPVNQDFWGEHPTKIRCFTRETPGFLRASKEAGRPQSRVVILGVPCFKAVVKLLRVLPKSSPESPIPIAGYSPFFPRGREVQTMPEMAIGRKRQLVVTGI